MSCRELEPYTDPAGWSLQRDEIKSILVHHLKEQTTDYWMSILEPADIWCARVMTWDELMDSEGFRLLDMVQDTVTSGGVTVQTLACPSASTDSATSAARAPPSWVSMTRPRWMPCCKRNLHFPTFLLNTGRTSAGMTSRRRFCL